MCIATQSVPATAYATEPETQAVEQTTEEWSEEDSEAALKGETAEESSAPERETAEESIAPESETAEESSPSESETTEESIAPESETEEESSPSESETAEEESSAPERETAEESSTLESELVPEEASVDETEAVTEENSTEEAGTVAEEASAEETETEQETDVAENLQEAVSETVLSLGEIEVDLKKTTNDDYYGYVFEAPEDGEYIFSLDSAASVNVQISIYRNKTDGEYTDKVGYFTYYSEKAFYAMTLKKGDVRYIGICPSKDGTFQIGMAKIPTANSVVETETGYRVEMDQFTADIDIMTGYQRICLTTKLTAKEGNSLADQYKLCAYARREGVTGRQSEDTTLYSDQYYGELNFDGMRMETEYTISIYLCDKDTGDVLYTLISESDNVSRTTLRTDKDYVIINIKADYHSAMIEHEEINSDAKYALYYAPKDSPEQEKRISLSPEGKDTINGLTDDTEYVFAIYNKSGEKVEERSVKTEQYPGTVTYTVEPAGPGEITVAAEISYEAGWVPDNYVYFYCVMTDEDGESTDLYDGRGRLPDDDNKITFPVKTIGGLEANKKYQLNLYLREVSDSIPFLAEKTVEVTTSEAPFTAEDVTFTMTPDETDACKVDLAIEVENYTERLVAEIKYRVKDSGEYYMNLNSYSFPDGKITDATVTFPQKGVTYEVRLYIAGIVITREYTTGEAEYLAEFSDDTDAYDSVLTFRLKSADGTAPDANQSYAVSLFYNDRGFYRTIISKEKLDSANNYSITARTAEKLAILPGRLHHLAWKVYVASGDDTSEYFFYQTIQTKESTITADLKECGIDYADFELSMGGRTEYYSGGFYLYQYIKEGNGSYRQLDTKRLDFTAENDFKLTDYHLSDLKAGTKYTVSIRNTNDEEYGTFSFETPADDKTIAVTDISTYVHSAYIEATVSGSTYGINEEYVVLLFREKGTDGVWNRRSRAVTPDEPTSKFGITYTSDEDELKENTTYEYILGIGSPTTKEEKLKATVTGTFKTKKDERRLESTTDRVGYNDVWISVEVLDNTSGMNTYVYLFYRESGTETWKKRDGYYNNTDESFKVIMKIRDLKENTSYDYAVAIGDVDSECDSPDQFPDAKKAFGTFVTTNAKIPESITLSAQELKLNMAYDPLAVLRVIPTPDTAAADADWSSSNESVVIVDDEGFVSAKGCGEAVITAVSKYDSKLKAECKVSVKSYVVARKNGADISPVYDPMQGNKGDIFDDIGFYELTSDGRFTALSDFTVVSKNPAVAEWKNGGIYAKAGGSTAMTFDKDGYRATITVLVSAKKTGFGITALRSSDSRYPAIGRGEDTFELAYGDGLDLSYQAEGKISPEQTFQATDFTWTSSDSTVAAVSAKGVITPKKAGTAKITVKPKDTDYLDTEHATAVITLNIKPAPTNSMPEVYAVTNEKTNMKLADVAFPAEWGEGWEWKEPQTLLYSLPVHSAAYAFDAVYTGDAYYAYEGTVNVYISTITGMDISETAGNHRNVLMVSEGNKTDTLSLQIAPSYYGKLEASKYTVKVPDVKNLTITKNDKTGCYDITAGRKGTYTIKPQILIGDKVVATGSYKFKAVSTSQIESVSLTTDSKEGAVINGNMISFDASAETTTGSSFTVKATATDRDGLTNTTTKLVWSITDKSVATIRLSADTRTATVTVKGSGHAVIQVTAKDESAVSAQWKLEIQDHRPRVSVSKVTVNTAYDYDSNAGRSLAYNQNGSIEIVPVYGESIENVRIINAQTNEADSSLGIVNYSNHDWVVKPVTAEISTSKAYPCRLEVTTSAGTYTYPLTASIINKIPKVTAKITKGVNLFYIADEGEVEITLESTLFSISSLKWEDATIDNGTNAFERGNLYIYVARPHNKKYCRIKQDKVRVENGALVDAGVDQITMTLKLSGVREEYKIPIKIKTTYQKPTLKIKDIVTGKNVSNMIPSVSGGNAMHFSVYDNLLKSTVFYTEKDIRSKNYYDQISCDSDKISLSPYDYFGMTAVYSGIGKQETVNYTIGSAYWREPLRVSHTIRTITPKAVLSRNNLTFNTNYVNIDSVSIGMDKYSDALELTDVEIRGANAKAQALLDDCKLEIVHEGTELQVQLNKLKYMKGDVPAGKYTYQLVPYYTNAQTGEKTALNTLKLVISFTNKAITAKASTKGSIDLSQSNSDSLGTNRIAVTAKFVNVGSDFEVTGARLTGEYSKYFSIRKYVNTIGNPIYYIKIKSDQKGKLKAGQNYKLRVVYTVQMTGGESVEVTSNVLNVKPKQTAPKITVAKNSQTLYVASNLTRTYTISVPNSSYAITDAYGSIDVNKDGTADITVTTSSISEQSADLTVQITDQDGIPATASGKTYSIPVTVKVLGRDGITKDASVVIKVKVKR